VSYAASGLGADPILIGGSEEQKKKYMPKIATGELRLQSMGVTEPTAGTDGQG
jgi:alkylation response protein AidB-like acyl-CoA dehydrogenase